MSATLLIRPSSDIIDVPRRITLSGFKPGSRVELTASSRTNDQATWSSRAVFQAHPDGTIDLSRDAPLEGDYAGVDAQGLIWSQKLQSAAAPADTANLDPIAPIVITIKASGNAGENAQGHLEQHLIAPGVQTTALKQDGLVGTLYTPAGPGPHPAIMYLNGSGGGVNDARAALLASHGFAALALGYFGAPGLPSHISATPLEYFEKALRWLRERVQPANGFVAVSGQSRGGELSLLLGSTFPELVSAVVAYVPSSVVHGVLAAGRPEEGRYAPAWTLAGKPLSTVWENNAAVQSWAAVDNSPEPRRQAHPFVDAQKDNAAVLRARIPVERIRGPVQLISGGDDGFWPSAAYARHVAQQLLDNGHAYRVEHLEYPQAGHYIQAPYVPTTAIAKPHPVAGVVLTAGGTPASNAYANADSWIKVLQFLSNAAAAHVQESPRTVANVAPA